MNNSFDFWERLSAIVIGLVAALGGPIGFLFGRRQRNAEASKIEADAGVGISNARKLDAETLQVVSTVYQNIIAELRKELTELNGRMDKMEEELQETQKELRAAREGLVERDGKISDMQRHITQLEKQLKGKEDKV